MELKEFIKTAVSDIVSAVSELQTEFAENGAIVNPPLPHPISNGSVNVGKGNEPIQRLTFDVALTTTEASSVDGGAKGGVAIFSAKVGTEQQSSSQNVSRLSFVIPVVLPVAEVMTASEKHSEACRQNLRKLRAEIDSGYADKTKAKQQPRESNMQLHQQNDLSPFITQNLKFICCFFRITLRYE